MEKKNEDAVPEVNQLVEMKEENEEEKKEKPKSIENVSVLGMKRVGISY